MHFNGNNKTADELKLALDWGIGRIVVDNFDELELLNALAHETGVIQNILLRLTPGVDPHTHRHTTTGILDSKFGFPLANGQAEKAVAKAISSSNLNLVGLHFHLGSPIPDTSPYQTAISLILNFAREMKAKHDFRLDELSPGGGFAVRYTADQQTPSIADYAEAITARITRSSQRARINAPEANY